MMSHFLYRQCYFQTIQIETSFLKYQFLFVVQLQMKQTKLFLQASYLCFIHYLYPLFIYTKHNTNQIFRFNPYFSKFQSSKFLKFSSISGSSLEWERHRILIPTLVSPYQVLHVFGFLNRILTRPLRTDFVFGLCQWNIRDTRTSFPVRNRIIPIKGHADFDLRSGFFGPGVGPILKQDQTYMNDFI